jgi:WD40 repeat protein
VPDETKPRLFLSYARGDDEPFVRRLHGDLTARGCDVWFDRVSMPSRQLTFHQEIADAISARDRLVLVVGPKAATSDYVRQEWRWAFDMDKVIVPILRLGDYPIPFAELNLLHCEDFRDDARYADAFANLARQLSEPAPPLGRLIAVPALPPHLVGDPARLRALRDAVISDLQKPVVITGGQSFVGLEGMAGIGKSVLASVLAHDRQVRQAYPDGVVWLPFGQQPDVLARLRDLVKALGGDAMFESLHQGKGILRSLLLDKAVMLVFDDVWRTEHLDPFQVLGPRCRAVVTTRDAGIVATLAGVHHRVELLDEARALELLAKSSGQDAASLPADAHNVMKECDLLPLALALCGGMARGEHGVSWRAVLDALRRARLEEIEDEQAPDPRHRSIWRALQVSVEALEPNERTRLAELSVFDEDESVPEAAVRTLWGHTGGMGDLACEKLLKRLWERSLIDLDTRAASGAKGSRLVSMHDLVHDYATRLAGDAKILHGALLDAYRAKCPGGWHEGPDDGWFFQRLPAHFVPAGRADELRSLLLDYRWMRAKLLAVGPQPVVEDFTLSGLRRGEAGGGRTLDFVAGALRLSAHVLARDPKQLPSQLHGRLLGFDDEAIRTLLEQTRRVTSRPWLRPLHPTLTPPGGPLVRTLTGHSEAVLALAVTPDGRRAVSASADRTLRVWDLETGETLRTLSGHTYWVTAVAVTPDGRRAVSASEDQTLRVWDVETGETVRTLTGHASGVSDVAVTPNGRRAVSASDDETLRVWDLETGEMLRTITRHAYLVFAVAVTPDGRRAVSASWDQTLRVWDLESGRTLRFLKGHTKKVCAVAIAPDGRHAISASMDQTLRLWDLKTGRSLRTLAGHTGYVTAVGVTPDGRRAVSASEDHTLRVWDIESGETLRTLTGHATWVTAVAVTPDGRRALTTSEENRTLRVSDLETGESVLAFEADGDLLSVALDATGTVVAGDLLGQVHFLRLDSAGGADWGLR